MFYFIRFNSIVFIFNNFHFLEVWYPHSGPSASFPALLKRIFPTFLAACLQLARGGNNRIVQSIVLSGSPAKSLCSAGVSMQQVQLCSAPWTSSVCSHNRILEGFSPSSLISEVGTRCNAWKNWDLYKSAGKQFLRFTGLWCLTELVWWKANWRNSLGRKVPHWLLEECRAGKCRILSGCQFGS